MSFLSQALKPLLVRCFASQPTTAIRAGILKGRLLPRSIAAANLSMVFGKYENKIQAVLAKQCLGCAVAYDVGAHVGFISLVLAELMSPSGRVYAFEPSPREADLIQDLIECNALGDRMFVQRYAVCDEVGDVCFHSSDATFTGILGKAVENHQQRNSSGISVKAITLDAFVYDHGHPPPDIIKLDVESAEPLVIAGARRLISEKRPRFIIEVHGPEACRDTLIGLLAHEYQVDLLAEHGLERVTKADQLHSRFRKNAWTLHILAVPT